MDNWLKIKGYEGHYMVSNTGKIKSVKFLKEIILKLKDNRGYKYVILYKPGLLPKSIKVHRLVLKTFNLDSKLQVNHIDGCKANNRLENLEYCTSSENQKHAYKIGLQKPNLTSLGKKGSKSFAGKKIKQINIKNKLIRIWDTLTEASIELGISLSSISGVLKGDRKIAGGYKWKYFTS